jgi:hypothetical protein
MPKKPCTADELIESIREAHILLTSGHLADAIALLAVVVNSVPAPHVMTPAELIETVRGVYRACTSNNPDKMCQQCNCWKMTRACCS